MALTPAELTQTLRGMLERRKSYRDHPWIQRYLKGELSRAQLRLWIEQHYCTVGDVHDIFGPIYAGCPDPEVRIRLLENLWEEETGKVTGSAPHRELMCRLIEALGGSRAELAHVKPLPETVARRSFLRLVARTRPFYEAVAAISVAGEAQFGDMAEAYARVGEERYGLSSEATAFWWVHAKADKEHGGTAFDIVARWAQTETEQQQVIESVRQSLELAWCWFDGFVRATA
ncbi:MAG: iron-containing redox enzyme family protein [Candidatus Binatia bacterium]|nr:iron-containing redox enzyme family protein [Candidatus Binatia bacterium]